MDTKEENLKQNRKSRQKFCCECPQMEDIQRMRREKRWDGNGNICQIPGVLKVTFL